MQKWAKTSEIKSHKTCENLIVFFLIYKVVHYLNLFLGKVYLKNEWQQIFSEEKSIALKCHPVNVKGNWTHLSQKKYDQELRPMQYSGYNKNV